MKQSSLRALLSFILVLTLLTTYLPIYAVSPVVTEGELLSSALPPDDIYVMAEEESKRGTFEKHYLLSDGSFIAVSYAEAVHYRDEDGKWQEVDNVLRYEASSSRYVTANEAFTASFASRADQSELISLSSGGHVLSWGLSAVSENSLGTKVTHTMSAALRETAEVLPNASLLSGSAIAEGKSIASADTFDMPTVSGEIGYSTLFADASEISVDYTVFHNKVEEDIYIHAPTDVREFSMILDVGSLTARKNEDGSVEFLDAEGEMQYRVGIPYMTDAADEVLNDIEVTVIQEGSHCVIVYTPNEAWLTSEERVYPLMLDPSITTKEYQSNFVDTYVVEGDTANHSAEQKNYVGVRSGAVNRIYMRVNNLPTIDSSMPVIEVLMTLFLGTGTRTGKTVELYEAGGSWDPATITYANQPALQADNYIGSYAFNPNDLCYYFSLPTDVYEQQLAATNYGYVLKYVDESNYNPDYNLVYGTEFTTSYYRPMVTVIYGYSLPTGMTSGGIYTLQNAGSYGGYLSVSGSSDVNGANVCQAIGGAPADVGANQKFKLEYVPSTGGYIFRAMCSSGGTNRVLDIKKINGYVVDGCNVQIYANNDPIAQEWLIIGLSSLEFKIVPRTNMSLALTVYPSSENGTAGGTTTGSVGNIFVSTYDENNPYQQWSIYNHDAGEDEPKYILAGSRMLSDGTYYINNFDSGKYLHSTGSDVDGQSGLIADLGDTIRWELTYVGDGDYVIRSASDPTKYLSVTASSSAEVNLTTVSGETIPDSCRWKLSNSAHGGVLIRNDISYIDSNGNEQISDHTLYHYNNTLAAGALPSSSNYRYDRYVWRVASTDLLSERELENFDAYDIRVDVSETKDIHMYKQNSDAIWTTESDFICEAISATIGSHVLNWEEGTVVGNNYGSGQYRVTHKVTGLTDTFKINVAHFDEGTYYIQNRKYELYLQIDDDADNQSASGTIMEQWDFDADIDQKWTLTFVGDGYYKITSSLSGLAITVPVGYESTLDVNVELQAYTGAANQMWRIIRTHNGSYKIKAKSSEGYTEEDLVLDVQAKGTFDSEEGLNIQQRDYIDNDSYGDEWLLEPYSVVLYGITNAGHDHISCLNTLSSTMLSGTWNDVTVREGVIASSTCKNDLLSTNVFTSRSHGLWVRYAGTDDVASTGIILDDKSSDNVAFYSHSWSSMSSESTYIHTNDDYTSLDVALFIGCETAKGGKNARNLPSTIVEQGAFASIGFSESIMCGSANTWTMNFYEKMLQGATLQEAVDYACSLASDSSGLKSAVICGDSSIRFPIS